MHFKVLHSTSAYILIICVFANISYTHVTLTIGLLNNV